MSLLNETEVRDTMSESFDDSCIDTYAHGLKPIPVPVAGEDSTYVYMRRLLGTESFHIRIGYNLVRVFTLKTMPMKLKEVLAMIHAIDWPCKDDRRPPMSRPDYVPEHFLDTGWMTSTFEYVVCLPNSFLDELQGKSVSNDTVREGE
jgi:hypothetical protein